MPIIRVETQKTSMEDVKLEYDLFWYDHVTKQMLKFNGGRLNMRYRLEEEGEVADQEAGPQTRWLPVVEDIFHRRSVTKDTERIFEIPDDEAQEFIDELKENDYEYEIIG